MGGSTGERRRLSASIASINCSGSRQAQYTSTDEAVDAGRSLSGRPSVFDRKDAQVVPRRTERGATRAERGIRNAGFLV